MLTLSEVKQWLRLEEGDTAEDALLQSLIDAATEYLRNALTSWPDPSQNPLAKIVLLSLIADMYENREATTDARSTAEQSGLRPTIRNLIAQLKYAYPEIETAALPDATVGVEYAAILRAGGGTPPYRWEIIAGALPDGLMLDEFTGKVTGTPTTAGLVSVTFQLTDSSPTPKLVSRPVSIRVVAAP